jgi:hypothetical protein
VLTRLPGAAARHRRAARLRVPDPLGQLDRAAVAHLIPLLVVARALLRTGLHAEVDRTADLVADRMLRASGPAHRRAGRSLVGRWVVRPSREIAVATGLVLLVGVAALGLGAQPPPQVAVQAVESQDRPGAWLDRRPQSGSTRPEARPAPAEPTPPPATAQPPAPAAVQPPAPVVPLAPPPAEAFTFSPTPLAPSPVPSPTPAAPSPGPEDRWLPTGTGMWLHEWARSEAGDAAAVVARSQESGFSHLYVQTGSTKKGWIGDEVLGQLLPATAGTGLKVVAWDFPKLIDPEDDARRMARAAQWNVPGVPRVAAVAPDVETAAEGTRLSADAVTRYYATLRAALPAEIAVLATVPWPSEKRTGFYPYAETAEHSDAFVPMAYWYNRAPDVVTSTSVQWLARFGLPVMPVGQGYDGRLDVPSLAEDPDPGASVQAFVDAARAGGARSISLWSWQTTGPPQWDALARASAGSWPPE